MSAVNAKQKLINLGNALSRLEEALGVPETNSLAIDGTVQRFEFVYELFWKTFKSLLELEGVETTTPKEALQKAYQSHWLADEASWLQMLKDRNETSHIYNESTAKRIYNNIKNYFPEMKRTYEFLLKRFPVD
jgi:nucleotidyltransferase substrate binding protein (TIGR01987 family)